MSMKEISLDSIDTKDKKDSSDGSLVIMNTVASGDNVASIRNSTQKLRDEPPTLVPCCEGRELQITQELVHSGLSAISVKHDTVLECLSVTRAHERTNFPFSTPSLGLVKHRNSFRSLHRPELKRVPCLRKMSPSELESLFRGYTAPESKLTGHDAPSAAQEPQVEECVRVLLPTHHDAKDDIDEPVNGGAAKAGAAGGGALEPIAERLCGASACASVASEDVPSGMRLHGARARLYTSVLASARAGDQLDGVSVTEQLLDEAPESADQEEAATGEPLTLEELQIILSPKREDQMPIDPSTTTAVTDISST